MLSTPPSLSKPRKKTTGKKKEKRVKVSEDTLKILRDLGMNV
jgi:hypothetical protein